MSDHPNACHCRPCSRRRHIVTTFISGAQLARNEVAKARKEGRLPPATNFACRDCGGAAREYDHRDYGSPLAVEPVCPSCNVRRGKGLPKVWQEGELQGYLSRARSGWRAVFIEYGFLAR